MQALRKAENAARITDIMRAVLGFVSILMALGIGFLIYSTQIQSGPEGQLLPEQADLTAVRRDLLSLGQAERLYWAANGSYATIEQLRNSKIVSALPENAPRGYEYDIQMNGLDDFLITARPKNPELDLPTLSIDKQMQIFSSGTDRGKSF